MIGISDAVTVALVTTAGLVVVATITVGGGIFLARMSRTLADVNETTKEIHVLTNARLTELVAEMRGLRVNLVDSRRETADARQETAVANEETKAALLVEPPPNE